MTKEMSASPFADNAMALWDAVSEDAQTYTMAANFVGAKGREAGRLGSSALNTLGPLYGTDSQSCAGADSEEAFVAEFDALPTGGRHNQQKPINPRRTDWRKLLVAKG